MEKPIDSLFNLVDLSDNRPPPLGEDVAPPELGSPERQQEQEVQKYWADREAMGWDDHIKFIHRKGLRTTASSINRLASSRIDTLYTRRKIRTTTNWHTKAAARAGSIKAS
ncbi:hypothetical protein E2P81_ATG03540 [Venturia nashicola]|uniref:Uncharacterized protein n=1 Tax=Venturia nashicola TaxID=86259 RepID=A0A4Z1PRR8_9PEZI|nr:hypothetical protein E6O75_ATG03615 [Venturia nashicola]TLD37865.1 hypothetical protein E2P81_ATG03540 [Venturia nashicola]